MALCPLGPRGELLFRRARRCRIEMYFDAELDFRWHITEWFYSGDFDPMKAAHDTYHVSFITIREVTKQGSSQKSYREAQGFKVDMELLPMWQTLASCCTRPAGYEDATAKTQKGR